MPSKQIIDRQKRSLLVIAAGREHADKIQAAYEAMVQPDLAKKEEVPDVRALVLQATRRLELDTAAMLAASEAHDRELGDDGEPRDRRDAAATMLYGTVGDLREIATGVFGSAILASLGISGETPRDPALLSSYAGVIVGQLRSPKLQLPPPRVEGARFRPDDWATRIDKQRAVLDQALKDVAREQREADTTLVARNNAVARHDDTQRRVAGLISGLLEFAGEDELATRVRPPERAPRTRKPTADPDGTTPGDGTPTEDK